MTQLQDKNTISWNKFKPLLNKYAHTPSDLIIDIIKDNGSNIYKFVICKGGWLKLYLTDMNDQIRLKINQDIKDYYPDLWKRVQLLQITDL